MVIAVVGTGEGEGEAGEEVPRAVGAGVL